MEDCELIEIKPKTQVKLDISVEEDVDAGFGPLLVARQGAKFKPNTFQCCIITFHDLGLNHQSNFQAFFNYHRMRPVVEKMPIFHINAPGQQDDAGDLPDDYNYPTLQQLAESIGTVCNYFGIKQAIGLGVGLGANVMARAALKYPDLIEGLFLINPVPTPAGWVEWAYQKRNIYYLNGLGSGISQIGSYDGQGFPQCIVEYLVWHHFGPPSEQKSNDLLNMYKDFFSSMKVRPRNLAKLIESYINRDDIGVERDTQNEIQCPTLVLCGNDSPFLEDSVNMNQRLRPDRSTWMKLFDSGLVLDEQPEKVSEAFVLFIQGLGLGLLTCYKFK